MANSIENYVRALSKLESRISNIERNNQSQAFTSIENTRLEFKDEDGNVTGTLGINDDGSTGFVPVLPDPEVKEPRTLAVPSAPLLDQNVSAVAVTWDGLTVNHVEFPLDFYCLEIHASEEQGFEASDLTLVSALYETEPSSVVVGPILSGTWYFKLRLRARNGEVSEASAETSIEVELDLPTLNGKLANAGGGTNYYQPTAPTGEEPYPQASIWFDTSADPDTGLISYMPHHWTEADGWVSLEDQRIQAIKDAQEDFHVVLNETQQKASDAQEAADSALTTAQDAVSTADEAKADATAKAQAAEQAAKAYADAEAEAARLAAIAIASGDAQAKADAAKAQAKADAALDASQKANAAQQAAEAKAAEAKSAADAAQATADDARSKAEAAHTAAGNAQSAADAAMQAATHNAKNLFSTANPSGTAPKGTIWFKTDSSNRVIGQWQQTGGTDTTDGSTWTARTLTNSVIANLDAGKITSGYIDVARLKAGSIDADVVLVPGSAGSTVIKDGAITTAKIATGAITAESGVIGSLDLGKATVGELDGVRIKAGSINTSQLNSTAINGMEIVAAKIYTSKSGARIQLLTTGLSAYSSGNVRTFNIATNTGDVEMIGKLYTGTSGGYRTVLNQESWDDFSEFPIYGGGSVKSPMVGSGLRLGKDTSVTTSAEVFYAEETYYTGTVSKYLRLNGPTVSSRRSELAIGTSGLIGGYRNTSNALFLSSISADKDSAVLRHETGSNSYFSYIDVGQVSSSEPTIMIGAKASTAMGDMNSIYIDKSGVHLSGAGKSTLDLLESSSSGVYMQINTIYDRTSGNAANVYITSNGIMARSTSARKYKENEQVISAEEYTDKLLSIPFKKWNDKKELKSMTDLQKFREENPMCPIPQDFVDVPTDGVAPEYIGAIAEDFIDAGLSEFVVFNEYGDPEELKYDRIGPALIPIVRDLRNRIEELEDLIANT